MRKASFLGPLFILSFGGNAAPVASPSASNLGPCLVRKDFLKGDLIVPNRLTKHQKTALLHTAKDETIVALELAKPSTLGPARLDLIYTPAECVDPKHCDYALYGDYQGCYRLLGTVTGELGKVHISPQSSRAKIEVRTPENRYEISGHTFRPQL